MVAYFDSGFFVRQPAWHRMGTVLDDYPGDWQEARRLAGLEWEPIQAPDYQFVGLDADGNTVYDRDQAVTGDYVRDAERLRIVRSDTGTTLGVTSEWYQIITHTEMGDVVEAILEQANVRYETAGVLRGGRQVWALAYLDEPVTLPGDNSLTLPYLAILNSHDGTGACKVLPTSVRVVCANTFSAAEAEGESNGTVFSFAHARNWRDRIDEARQAITGVRRSFAAYTAIASDMLNLHVDSRQTERFIVEFIPMPPSSLVSDRVARNVEQARDVVRQILAGPTTETIAGTAFSLVQAAGEYLDHYRAYRSMDSYFSRQLVRPEKLKIKAVHLVRDIVKV